MMPNTPIMAAKREQAKHYDIEMMPSERYTQSVQESGFRYRTAQRYTAISVFDDRFYLCPAGCVSHCNKQGTCTASSHSNRLSATFSLGASP